MVRELENNYLNEQQIILLMLALSNTLLKILLKIHIHVLQNLHIQLICTPWKVNISAFPDTISWLLINFKLHFLKCAKSKLKLVSLFKGKKCNET